MDESTYMLRSSLERMWHLPGGPGKTQWKTLCSMPIYGREQRLAAGETPKPEYTLCPKCQQIKRAQERMRAKADEADKLNPTDTAQG